MTNQSESKDKLAHASYSTSLNDVTDDTPPEANQPLETRNKSALSTARNSISLNGTTNGSEINVLPKVNNRKWRKRIVKKLPKGRALKCKTDVNKPTDEFFLNEIVLATIPGYCPWPACILGINGETYFVRFFGSGDMLVYVWFFLH